MLLCICKKCNNADICTQAATMSYLAGCYHQGGWHGPAACVARYHMHCGRQDTREEAVPLHHSSWPSQSVCTSNKSWLMSTAMRQVRRLPWPQKSAKVLKHFVQLDVGRSSPSQKLISSFASRDTHTLQSALYYVQRSCMLAGGICVRLVDY